MRSLAVLFALFGLLTFAGLSCEREPEYYVKRVEVDDATLYRDLGLDVARFEVKAPPDTKVMVWLETYKEGKLVQELSWGGYRVPSTGEAVNERFRWTAYRQPTPNQPEMQKVKWEFGLDHMLTPRWIDDPFAPYRRDPKSSCGSHSGEETWELELGKTYLLWHRAASKSGSFSIQTGGIVADFEERPVLKGNDLEMMIMCRIEAADPNRTGPHIGPITVPP